MAENWPDVRVGLSGAGHLFIPAPSLQRGVTTEIYVPKAQLRQLEAERDSRLTKEAAAERLRSPEALAAYRVVLQKYAPGNLVRILAAEIADTAVATFRDAQSSKGGDAQ